MLDSKDSFDIEVTVSTGDVWVYVGANPDTVCTEPKWMNRVSVGTARIDVKNTDPHFHMGTWYYICVKSMSDSALLTVKVSQLRQVELLANNYVQKFQFMSKDHLVKFLVFQVPTTWSSLSTTELLIEALTPNFYPTVYVKLLEFDTMPSDFETLLYPSIIDYDLKFGENLSHVIYSDKVSKLTS